MSLDEAINSNTSSSDFTLLEGLYQLAVTGHTNDWEFERLNNAVYEDVNYSVRMEPGVQTPCHTLQTRIGSCRGTWSPFD